MSAWFGSGLVVLLPCKADRSLRWLAGLVSCPARQRGWLDPSHVTIRDMSHDPDSADILAAVDEVDWHAYSMPPSGQWYRADDVPAAFRLLVTAASREEGRGAYNRMLSAIGNNHAGRLYPDASTRPPSRPRRFSFAWLVSCRVGRAGLPWRSSSNA